jgi:hypothetical protein
MIHTQPITEMAPRRDYWAAPWAMSIDGGRRCYLSAACGIHEQPVGTAVRMRLRLEVDGIHVHLAGDLAHDRGVCGYRWPVDAEDGDTVSSPWFTVAVAALWIDGVRQDTPRLPEELVEAA